MFMNNKTTTPASYETYVANDSDTTDGNHEKVGLIALAALIVSGTISSGIFALPTPVTTGAGTLGILIGWTIVITTMLALVSDNRNLTLRQTNIDDGIYGWSST